MAHEVETMAYANEKPWHGLGVPVSSDLTPEQIMVKAGLDWEVEEVESYIKVGGEEVPTGQKSLVRVTDNKILTNVGEGWNPVQNKEAFEFFNEFVLAGDMNMETAGSLKGGRNVFALAKVNSSFDVVGDDRIDQYLLFSNPHEYGKSIDIRMTGVRVVCNNTLTMSLAIGSNNSVKINHRSIFDPETVKEKMGLASEKFAKYQEMAKFLASKPFSVENLVQYYNEIFPRAYAKDKQVEKVEDLTRTAQTAFEILDTQPGAEYGKGTWWQAFNSITYLTDHELGRSQDTRMQSAWFGPNHTKKLKAANKAVEYAMAS